MRRIRARQRVLTAYEPPEPREWREPYGKRNARRRLLHAMSVMVDVAGMRSLCGGIFPLVCDMCSVVIDKKKMSM